MARAQANLITYAQSHTARQSYIPLPQAGQRAQAILNAIVPPGVTPYNQLPASHTPGQGPHPPSQPIPGGPPGGPQGNNGAGGGPGPGGGGAGGGGGGGGPPAGGGGGGGAPPGGPPLALPFPPPPVVPAAFALVPSQVNLDYPMDYENRMFMSVYQDATKPLYSDTTAMFDCDQHQLNDFLALLRARAVFSSWQRLFLIDDSQGLMMYFLDASNHLTEADIYRHVLTYIATGSRLAQQSLQLYQALLKSLSNTGRSKLRGTDAGWTILGHPSGVMFLKFIIKTSMIDTKATSSLLATQLIRLPQHMKSIRFNIEKFNLHVETLREKLRQRNEQAPQLIHNVLMAYREVKDPEFNMWYSSIRSQYDSDLTGQTVTLDKVLDEGLNKFKTVESEGNWKTDSNEDRIVALEAKLVQAEKRAGEGSKRQNKSGNKSEKKKQNKSSEKDGGKKKPKKAAQLEWMTKPPKDAELMKSKTVNSKEYWWCTALKRWCRHHPDECKAKEDKGSNKKGSKGKKATFAKALTAALADSDEESSSQE